MELLITPQERLTARDNSGEPSAIKPGLAEARLLDAFHISQAQGLLRLATSDLKTDLPPEFDFARQFAKSYLSRLCQVSLEEAGAKLPQLRRRPSNPNLRLT